MREIKFRAWEEDAGIEDGVDMRFWSWKEMNEMDLQQMFNNPKYKIMQYTGLTDKNGKEIYEGDVVLFNGDDKELIKKMTVKWTEAEFVLLINTKDWAYSLSGTPSSCLEIIGNIYEHSHLLEVTK